MGHHILLLDRSMGAHDDHTPMLATMSVLSSTQAATQVAPACSFWALQASKQSLSVSLNPWLTALRRIAASRPASCACMAGLVSASAGSERGRHAGRLTVLSQSLHLTGCQAGIEDAGVKMLCSQVSYSTPCMTVKYGAEL